VSTFRKILAGVYGVHLLLILPWFLGSIYRQEQSLWAWQEYSVHATRHSHGDAGDKTEPAEAQATLRDALKRAEAEFIRLIDQIPIEWEPHLAAAKTPFTTCLMIGDAISGAQRRIDYFDRYLDPDLFPLYLRKLRRNVAAKLITTRGNAQYGVVAVQALARLAAQEFSAFSLVECTPADLHDRNVRVDDVVFHLGPSTNAVGRYPTNFTPGDSTSHGHQVLDDIIAAGTVVV